MASHIQENKSEGDVVMTTDLLISSAWWGWWSNPLVRIHNDHLYKLALTIEETRRLDYFKLLEIRNLLALDEIPDELIQFKPYLRCLAYATAEQVANHMAPLSLFTLDNSILHARPNEWEEWFGVFSADQIRDLVAQRAALPKQLSEWHGDLSRSLSLNLKSHLHLVDRTSLCLGLILKSFTPALFNRWILMHEERLAQLIKVLDPINTELWDPLGQFLHPLLTALNEESSRHLTVVEFDFNLTQDDLEFDEDLINPVDLDCA